MTTESIHGTKTLRQKLAETKQPGEDNRREVGQALRRMERSYLGLYRYSPAYLAACRKAGRVL